MQKTCSEPAIDNENHEKCNLEADYQTPSKNFKYSALKSENLSSFVFNTLRNL